MQLTKLISQLNGRGRSLLQSGPSRLLTFKPSRRATSAALLVAGLSLLLFSLASYGWMYYRQHQLTSTFDVPRSPSLVKGTDTAASSSAGITLLTIPGINLKAAVLDGVDRKSLLLAPGHLPESAWPENRGNVVIAAHRDTFFRHIGELRSGDDVFVSRNGHQFHYVVKEKSIVSPSDLAVVQPTLDDRLTLITCYPTYYIGPAPKRMIVVAELQPGSIASRQP